MAETNQKDARLMEVAREVLAELTDKTVALYSKTNNADLMALKQSAGKDLSSTEMTAIMHMMVFLSDDSVSAKMKNAVDAYMSE